MARAKFELLMVDVSKSKWLFACYAAILISLILMTVAIWLPLDQSSTA